MRTDTVSSSNKNKQTQIILALNNLTKDFAQNDQCLRAVQYVDTKEENIKENFVNAMHSVNIPSITVYYGCHISERGFKQLLLCKPESQTIDAVTSSSYLTITTP